MTILFILVICGELNAATYYIPDNFSNLRAACAGISAGDTIIIRDGTYSGSNNYMDDSHLPPSGSTGSYTTIKAEHDGMAIFPDGFLRMQSNISRSYIRIEGIKSLYKTEILSWNHCKFLRCAFTHETSGQSDDPVFGIGDQCSYILLEDCWAWGAGRYKFLAYGASAGNTHHIIFRRCVTRFDRVNSYSPMANFSIYRANQVALQNCIAIDGDQDQFWVAYEERGGAFYTHHGSQDTIINGCIVLNHKSYGFGGAPNSGLSVNNTVVWGASQGSWMRCDQGITSTTFSGLTLGHMRSVTGVQSQQAYGILTWGGSITLGINNSILTDINANYAMDGYELLSNYNTLYNNNANFSSSGGPAGANDYCSNNSNAIDPLDGSPGNGIASLKYLPRVETGSNNDGTGSNGVDRGATILYKIGISGTYYGETGWNTVTSDPLWPWPNENRIRTDMRAYSYTGTTYNGTSSTLSGARGFCADGQTLSKYIWEYLGNTIPTDIYGNSSSEPTDTTPPASPSGITVIIQ